MTKRTFSLLAIGLLLIGSGWLLSQPTARGQGGEAQQMYLPLVYGPEAGYDLFGAEDFTEIAPQGFGDRQNSVAWSMQWWNDHLYVGTGRAYACFQAAIQAAYLSYIPYPPNDADLDCAPTPQELPLQAEIWRWTPATASWVRLYQAPENIPIPDHPGQFVSPDIGYRGMATFEEPDGSSSLYVAGYSSRDFNEPSDTGQALPYPRILYSNDGTTFEPIPQDPGTFMGDLDNRVNCIDHERIYGFREMTTYNDKLYIVAGGGYGDGCVIESANPSEGNDAFRQVTPPSMSIASMTPFNGYLYLGTGDNPLPPDPTAPGYTIYKTTATGVVPYQYIPVLTNGGFRPQSKTITDFEEFEGRLYAGTNQPAELLRVNPDDTWDLLVGSARTDVEGNVIAPLSGFGDGFDWYFNIHMHRLQTHNGSFYVGTNDNSTAYRDIPIISNITAGEYGFSLYGTRDGVQYTPITDTGFGDIFNESARTFASTPYGMFLGAQNSYYGLRVWLADHEEPTLAAPVRAEAEVIGGRTLLSWEPVDGALRYRVFRATFTSNETLGIAELDREAWLPGSFMQVGSTTRPFYVDDSVRLDEHFYHYYLLAEDGQHRSSPASNLVRVPSLAPTMTFQELSATVRRWARPGTAVTPAAARTVVAALDEARLALAQGDATAARQRLAQLRLALHTSQATLLPDWRVTDLEALLDKLERRIELSRLGLLPAASIN